MSITRQSFYAAVVALPIAAVVAAAGIASAAPLPAEVRDGFNGVADQVQSQVADFGAGAGIGGVVGIGVGALAGAVVGGAVGAAVVGIPAAVVGAIGGGIIADQMGPQQ